MRCPTGAVWKLGASFLRAHATLMRQLGTQLEAETGQSLADFDVLGRLAQAGGDLRMTELADQTFISKSAMTRRVSRLVHKGLVGRSEQTRMHVASSSHSPTPASPASPRPSRSTCAGCRNCSSASSTTRSSPSSHEPSTRSPSTAPSANHDAARHPPKPTWVGDELPTTVMRVGGPNQSKRTRFTFLAVQRRITDSRPQRGCGWRRRPSN